MSGQLRLRLYSSPLGLYLTAEGRIDASTVGQVTTAVDLALTRLSPVRITVDLSAVTYLDIAGVATLIACRRDARTRGAHLTVAQPSSQVRSTVLACGAGELLAGAATEPLLPAADTWRRCRRPSLRCLRPPGRARSIPRNEPTR
ncbi:STAS domain-containing protein [Catellatospora coxensis]|uniref:STAS domain-containing protein n=1 Tax=Catellatospora coxensis TaxID=310354 RepID=UPI0019422C53|nr:STAS domain-containing protein [Catellatospora coxensis]